MKANSIKMVAFVTTLIAVVVIPMGCSKSESTDTKVAQPDANPQKARAAAPNAVLVPQQAQQQPDNDMEAGTSNPAANKPATTTEEQRRVRLVVDRNQKLHELEQSSKLVGMELVQLEALLGKPTHLQNDGKTMIYRLDSGFGGIEWTFEMQSNKVSKATKQHLN